MNYGFQLNWEELPEYLQLQKKCEYIEYLEKEDPSYLENMSEDEKDTVAEDYISAHFPMYF